MNGIVAKSAEKLGLNVVHLENASMAGDDFSYFGERVPASYFKLGVGNKAIGACYPIHSPRFKADENALPLGAAIMAQIAIDYLNS
jgi:amidohydrolase